jgi:hypothetical protein
MPRSRIPSPIEIESEGADRQKYLLAQSIDHFMDTATLLSRIFQNDYTTMIVFMTILRESVSHLNRDRSVRPEAVSGVFPDTLRRPISILAISELAGFPYETTRRHVLKLVETGFCSRLGSREFIVSEDILRSDLFTTTAAQNEPLVLDFVDHVNRQLDGFWSGPASRDRGEAAAPPQGGGATSDAPETSRPAQSGRRP